MEKSIRASEIPRRLRKVLDDAAKGDSVIVERYGEPVAVLVPISIYAQWKRDREKAYDTLREISERVNMSPEEAEELVEEAISWVRSNKDELK
ncbi:MAG TPA: type II toxin-antitoxin system prevent-host-death family antitoxin [Chloroflexia bacterium]|nr:type II toxin-antitoxin system prevent-host-death family antitoxin [Chloroflexia bacterium]